MLIGPRLLPGDRVRIVSPASIPDRDQVGYGADLLRSWGLRVEMGLHVFDSHGHFLAGRDEDRLADINDALRDPGVRAIFSTRGGKGSYRIAHALDFAAAARDPKPLIGFSDITILHLALGGIAGSQVSMVPKSVGTESTLEPTLPIDCGALSWSLNRSPFIRIRARSRLRSSLKEQQEGF
jgi:muramoyltetrapeptide carboxypeptidase LdcA involved in peptidoglycan recycling